MGRGGDNEEVAAPPGAGDDGGGSLSGSVISAKDFHTPSFKQRVESSKQGQDAVSQAEAESLAVSLPQEEEELIQQETSNHAQQQRRRKRSQAAVSAGQVNNDNIVDDDEEEEEVAAAGKKGTVLVAAFVDEAYPWPPQEGQGKNAIELQASIDLLQRGGGGTASNEDEASVVTTESLLERMKAPKKPKAPSAAILPTDDSDGGGSALKKKAWWQCCKSNEAATDGSGTDAQQQHARALQEYQLQKESAKQARKAYAQMKRDKKRVQERSQRRLEKYNRVPEGILIYRLDTRTATLELLSSPHEKTDLTTLVQSLQVAHATASPASRRGLLLTDKDGKEVTLTACEQRTAISWLEAMQLMLAKQDKQRGGILRKKSGSEWSKERLAEKELDNIEEQYLNLANYSNKLIRAGALPGQKKGTGGAGGVYYSVEKANAAGEGGDDDDEALEAIAKRRAVIKDSWDFYRMICSLLRDRHKYDEVFRKMQLDAVYPYLNSMTGLNDDGADKQVIQPDLPQYASMTRVQVAQDLVQKANEVLPSLVEIAKALAGSLGMQEVGVGPVKEVSAALRKAEQQYQGDILKVTDYCRALLVVKDLASLLALLELARDSFGPLIRRVKMSTLKADHEPKPGGYRDCILNVELKQHVCEIQVHLWPMWTVCGVDGFRHYRHCLEYSTDSFVDAYEALDGLDRKTMAELIVMAEEAVAETPLDNLEWYHEKYILDYFAQAGLFLKHDLLVWAEMTFAQLIRLRTESPDIGPEHYETITLQKYLIRCLKAQGKHDEAAQVQQRVTLYEKARSNEVAAAEQSLWDAMVLASTDAYDMIVDPNRKEREREEALRKQVKASKRAWKQARAERFPFLDKTAQQAQQGDEEKKVDNPAVQ